MSSHWLRRGKLPADSGDSCRCKSLESPMSALGHKRTFCDVPAMSALPPKADIGCLFDILVICWRRSGDYRSGVRTRHLMVI